MELRFCSSGRRLDRLEASPLLRSVGVFLFELHGPLALGGGLLWVVPMARKKRTETVDVGGLKDPKRPRDPCDQVRRGASLLFEGVLT